MKVEAFPFCEREINARSGQRWKICGRRATVVSNREYNGTRYGVHYCKRHEKHATKSDLRSVRVVSVERVKV